MNDTVTVESIKRQLAALDVDFASDENGRTGRLQLAEFTKRRVALLARLRKAEQEDRDAPRVAQSQRAAPSARPFIMATADARQLRKFDLALDAALEGGNADSALAILQSEDYMRLTYLAELENAAELGAAAFAAVSSARSTLATRYISLAGLRRRALEDRVAALENAIPRYRGTHKAGETYDKNSIITDHGSMWIALKETDTRPPGAAWQQCTRGTR